ncbi:MAG: ABC transporter ATP-binding protein [Planctomycetota bacterium]|nr:MAG: ABC transporter ATP-binding protein [Planctomycetota bacterium]
MSDDSVIRVRGLTKTLQGQPVLRGVDLDVKAGEVMVILGGSGSGKSTLLRLMFGSIKPDEGAVNLLGTNICALCDEALDEARKRIGVLFQSGALFSSKTIRENVALPLREHTNLRPDVIDAIVKVKLEMVGLREHADKRPAELSGGMRKRAGFARAIALDPKILFCDEPSAGLDPVRSAELDRLIRTVSKNMGATCVVVTHEMDSAFTIADRLAMLDQGRIVAVRERAWFERLRDLPAEEARSLNEGEALVRQFLRGELDGPLSRRGDPEAFARDLFGVRARGASAG